MFVLTADEIRDVEKKCFASYYSEADLMLKAGTGCFNEIIKRYSDRLVNSAVSVLCGNGKNAGDGFVIARFLYAFGADVKIVLCDKKPDIEEPVMYYNQAVSAGVDVVPFSNECLDADFIVDTMFGIGFHGEARAPFDNIFKLLSDYKGEIICVDTPSGTNSTTGEVCKNCVKADFTIAISTLKYAHILPPANSYCGDTIVIDIGIPADCYNDNYVNAINFDQVKDIFPKCDKNANKGTFGTLLNLCGSYPMPGAAVICTKAALKTGAGLVKLTLPKSAYPLAAAHLVQNVFHPVSENDKGTFSAKCTEEISADIKTADCVAAGCGIGCNDDTKTVIDFLLENAEVPVILDADGINCISNHINILKDIKTPVVLTPHPGEMARMISSSVSDIQSDRINTAKKFAKKYGVILVLKGANTIVTDGKSVFVNLNGNPGMAMGGSGDMLSGMIGSFVAQGIAPFDAAKAAVFIHGKCGDITAQKLSMRSMTVCDMLNTLGTLMSEFE